MTIFQNIPKEILFVIISSIIVGITFNIVSKHYNSYYYKEDEEQYKKLEAKHYKLKNLIGDEEEIKLVEDLISSKVKIEAKSKLFCSRSKAYDILDKYFTEEILKRKK